MCDLGVWNIGCGGMEGLHMATKPTTFKDDEPAKKPYESPRLEVYGDIRAVTAAVALVGKNDGGHGSDKTG
jgi:hypothetical protein